jgi:hypothetical protein
MTMDPAHHDDSERKQRRFQFGLRTTFIVVTLLCLWFGFKFARERRANEMIARHERLLETILNNTVTPPPNAFYTVNPGNRDEVQSNLRSPYSAEQEGFLGFDLLHGHTSPARIAALTLQLDVSRLLPMNRDEVSQRMIVHYEQGLEKLGMWKFQAVTRINVSGAKSRCVWTSKESELSVVIDAEVAANAPAAEVRILVIDAQQRRLW